jgi:YspA, cpYpsA-related SLOG family
VRIVIFGSRNWQHPDPIETLIAGQLTMAFFRGEKLTVIHGDNGNADKFADKFSKAWGVHVIPVAADWGRYKQGAGPIRNGVILEKYRPEMGFGFRSFGESPGTDDMLEKLKKAGIPHFLVSEPTEATPTLF